VDQKQRPKKQRWRRKEKSSTAYSIPLCFGLVLNAQRSANAWWMDRQKVHDLIAAFSIGSTIPEACGHAGITIRQYKYFTQVHPDFIEARRGFVVKPSMIARIAIMQAINAGDVKMSWKYLAKTSPEEFGSPSRIAAAERKRELTQQQEKSAKDRSESLKMSAEEEDLYNKLVLARMKRIQESARERVRQEQVKGNKPKHDAQ